MNMRWKGISIALFWISAHVQAESYSFIEKFLEANLASAIVLSDSDFITLGMADFDPNRLLHTDNEELGTADSLKNRQSYSTFVFPYTWDWDEEGNGQAFVRFSLVQTEQELRWSEGSGYDDFSQQIFDMSVGYRYRYQLSDSWSLEPSLGVHFMHYKNAVSYQSTFGRAYGSSLDGLLFNTTAWATIYEPQVTFGYHRNTGWGQWRFSSSAHYFYGFGWGEANNGEVGHPEGWYLVNGLDVFYHVTHFVSSDLSIYGSLQRVDLGSDVIQSLEAPHYYQMTLGGLVTPSLDIPFIDNIGLGLSINYGSAFKGGGIVLFLNQK